MFNEIEENPDTKKVSKFDIVFLQAGVGSMAASGIFYYLNKFGKNKPKIVIVEPEEADGIFTSFKNNKISTSKGSSDTIMAGRIGNTFRRSLESATEWHGLFNKN